MPARAPVRHVLLACALMAGALGPTGCGRPEVAVSSAWVLPAAARPTTAAYLVLENSTEQPVRLLGAATAAASKVELHESVHDGQVMRMRAIDALVVPPHGRLALEPGGYHLMLTDLPGPLHEGDTVPLVLRLEQGGRTWRLEVKADVRTGPEAHAY